MGLHPTTSLTDQRNARRGPATPCAATSARPSGSEKPSGCPLDGVAGYYQMELHIAGLGKDQTVNYVPTDACALCMHRESEKAQARPALARSACINGHFHNTAVTAESRQSTDLQLKFL